MAVVSGGDRMDLRPLERRQGGRLGNHRKQFEWLNVPNARPGWTYIWEKFREGPMTRARLLGGIPVLRSDPEGERLLPEEVGLGQPAGVDNLVRGGDVALFRYQDEVIRERTKAKLERDEAARSGAEIDFLNKGEDRAAEAGSAAGPNSLYYVNKKRGHGYMVSTEER